MSSQDGKRKLFTGEAADLAIEELLQNAAASGDVTFPPGFPRDMSAGGGLYFVEIAPGSFAVEPD
jgi:hypothetical protein